MERKSCLLRPRILNFVPSLAAERTAPDASISKPCTYLFVLPLLFNIITSYPPCFLVLELCLCAFFVLHRSRAFVRLKMPSFLLPTEICNGHCPLGDKRRDNVLPRTTAFLPTNLHPLPMAAASSSPTPNSLVVYRSCYGVGKRTLDFDVASWWS